MMGKWCVCINIFSYKKVYFLRSSENSEQTVLYSSRSNNMKNDANN
jgi:hypothetical protein